MPEQESGNVDTPVVPSEYASLPVVPAATETVKEVAPEPVHKEATLEPVDKPTETPVEKPKAKPTEDKIIDLANFKRSLGDLPELEEAPKTTEVTPKPAKVTTIPRDFAGIEDGDKPLFQQMSNEAFAKMKALYLERAETNKKIEQLQKNSVPDSYFAHPDAYTLTPTWREHVKTFGQAQAIQRHWQQQLSNVRKGQPWSSLDFNEKGELVVGEASGKPDIESETNITTYLTAATIQASQVRDEVEKYRTGYLTEAQGAIGKVKGFEAKYFDPLIAGDTDGKYKKVMDNIRGQLPTPLQNAPLADLVCKSVAANLVQAQQILQLQKQIGAKSSVAKDVAAAQPNLDTVGSGNGRATPNVAIADFKKYLEGT